MAVLLLAMVIIIIVIVLYIVIKLFKKRRNPQRQATDEQMHRDNPAGVYGPVMYPAIGTVSSYEGAVCGGGEGMQSKGSPFQFLPPYPGSDAPPPYNNGTLPRTNDSDRYNLSTNENDRYNSLQPTKETDRYSRSNSESDRYSRPVNDNDRYKQPTNDSDRYNMTAAAAAAAGAVGGSDSWTLTNEQPIKMPISASSEKAAEAAASTTMNKMQKVDYAPRAYRIDTARPPTDSASINRYLGISPAGNSVQSAESFSRGRPLAANENERFVWSTQEARRQPSINERTNQRQDRYTRQPSDSDRYNRATNENERYSYDNSAFDTQNLGLAPRAEIGLPSAHFKLHRSANPLEEIYRTSNSSVTDSVQSSDFYR